MEVVHFKRGLVYDGLEERFLEYVGTDPDDYFSGPPGGVN